MCRGAGGGRVAGARARHVSGHDAQAMQQAPARAPEVRDGEWIEGIGRGDAGAFEAMVRAYGPQLARFAGGLLGSREDAEDIAQDVLWRVWEGRGAWRPTVSLRAYLFTAVRNRALNLLQRDRIRARYQVATQQMAQYDAELQEVASPADVLNAEEDRLALVAALRRAFAGLTERQQSAVRLRYEHGLTFPEVAAALAVSLSAAEKIVARAIRAMRVGTRDGLDEAGPVA
jgi:RNA polymerase sigma-70 factor (ECF subfamily)